MLTVYLLASYICPFVHNSYLLLIKLQELGASIPQFLKFHMKNLLARPGLTWLYWRQHISNSLVFLCCKNERSNLTVKYMMGKRKWKEKKQEKRREEHVKLINQKLCDGMRLCMVDTVLPNNQLNIRGLNRH